MIREAIVKLIDGVDLTRPEMAAVMNEVADGSATPAQIGAFLATLRVKGETVEEISGAAEVMRARAQRIHVRRDVFVDTCGTGGDGRHTFNISTAAALGVAGAGVTVAKHGNRSVSSRCGSADVLAALGVNVEAPREAVERCLEEVGIGFLFAPLLHPAFKTAAGVRRELGVRTVFNLLGPLANPAGALYQVMGVYDPKFVPLLGRVLCALGSTHAFVVHGDGYDEITVTGRTVVSEVKDGKVADYEITPEELGLGHWGPGDLAGGEATDNARILKDVLAGSKGAPRDAVLANAAAALLAVGAATSLRAGASLAAQAIDSGAASRKLGELVRVSAVSA